MGVDLKAARMREYESRSDEDIVEAVREGDSDALEYLINKYKNFVRAKARSYFLIGADREDIVQEGMIGLYKSIRDFKGDKLASFKAFAELCITRQIITAIKTATRQKHIPLNSYISLDKPIYDEDSDRTLMDVLSGSRVSDPEELIINQEEFVGLEDKMAEILSDLERQVLMLYLDGRSYQEIAVDLDRQPVRRHDRVPRLPGAGFSVRRGRRDRADGGHSPARHRRKAFLTRTRIPKPGSGGREWRGVRFRHDPIGYNKCRPALVDAPKDHPLY